MGYVLEVNLTKTKWTPKHVDEIPKVISYAFGRPLTLKDISPLRGSDHIKEWPIKEDKDIQDFLNAPTMLQEAFAEKLFRFREPRCGLMPKGWQPKKVKILATGTLLSKFFGEDEVSTRQVETSLKIYDCGHFYMKQTLPGSGPTPFWTIFEGAWEQKENGLRLEYRIRYSWQSSLRQERDVSIECQPQGPNAESSLAWVGDSESVLKGLVPAMVGEEKFCRVEIVREPDKVGTSPVRFNEDVVEKPPKPSPPHDRAGAACARGDGAAAGPEAREAAPSSSEGLVKRRAAPMDKSTASDGPGAAGPPAQLAQGTPAPTPARAPAPRPFQAAVAGGAAAEESIWPMFIGLGFFLVLLLMMGRFWWEDWTRRPDGDVFR